MPNENDRNSPSADPKTQPLPQSPVTPAAPHQRELRDKTDSGTSDKESETKQELELIRSGERWLIGIGAAGVIMNVVIAIIYFGQLKEMRTATRASAKAADASTVAAGAAQSQLGKMEESNRINREALESVQRAFVTFPRDLASNCLSGTVFSSLNIQSRRVADFVVNCQFRRFLLLTAWV
jgi:hypothetical protein